ncbi:hypothetical protein G6016_04935 [Dietzia aerolata]|uniref:Uncharacterized protein n=1 Tax=Dietzia aerolata TaxID=595984 RepID=A0ABV5JUL8_9ACTN|nr:hypothetical protein [Dietzia aerolata]MBB0968315.1 hypothetical protein [Dietzia aerolata]
MSRVRIHNYFTSLDGFAAGTYVTAEHPIGDAGALFAGFDGRFIHGLDHVEAPITVDRALEPPDVISPAVPARFPR